MFSGNLKTAVSSLRQSRWRTIFTMMGVIIGICSVVTVVSLGEGLKHQIVGQISQLGSDVVTIRPGKLVSKDGNAASLNFYAFLAPSTLTARDINSLQQIPQVKNVVPVDFVTNAASGTNGELDNVFVAGTTSRLASVLHQKIAYGNFLEDDDTTDSFAVVGSEIAQKLFGVTNPIGQSVQVMGQDYIIHGVLSPSSGGLLSIAQADYNNSVFISTSAAQTLTSGHTNILQVLVQADPGANIDQLVSDIRTRIGRNHGGTGDFTVLKQNELLGVTDQALSTVTSFVSGIAAISLLVGGIGIMDIMLVSVSERTREIGIRKALGATNRQILNQFLTEGLALTIGGGIIGVIISVIINQMLRLYTSWKPIITWPTVLLAVGVSVAAGIIFSIAPALKAARKDPITALRGE